MNADQHSVDSVLAGDIRSAAKLISGLEAGRADAISTVRALHKHGKGTPIIGITGAPGAGKSTFTDSLVAHLRKLNKRIAVLAVDPSSPFSGGAILGDRVRMNRHNTDSDVFIRSMAARGRLGAISAATADAVTVLDAMNFDYILIETVGVGQNELDIMLIAQSVIIVLTPAAGDEVQAYKAGLIEIGNVFVVNKSDISGADRLTSTLREAVEFGGGRNQEKWIAPIVKAQANLGIGTEEIYAALCQHRAYLDAHPEQFQKQRFTQMEARVLELIDEKLRIRYRKDAYQKELWNNNITNAVDRQCDPHEAAEKLIKAL